MRVSPVLLASALVLASAHVRAETHTWLRYSQSVTSILTLTARPAST